MNDLERSIRARVTQTIRDSALAPSATELASVLGVELAQVRSALRSLADDHLLVLNEGDGIVMAAPFSAVPTDFVVRIEEREWYANCAWDGLGILALLGDGILEVHLHDNDTFGDEHMPIGEGAIDWKRTFEDLFRHAPDAVKVIEVPVEGALKSLTRIRAGGYADRQLELL